MKQRALVPSMLLTLSALIITAFGAAERAACKEPVIKPGDRIAILGDSITEQKKYAAMIEMYFQVCQPQLKVDLINIGWWGEMAPEFLERMDRDLMPWKPTVVTTCYGMNDGRYCEYKEENGKRYDDAMRTITKKLVDRDVTCVLGSPGVVDSDTFRPGTPDAGIYNPTLGKLRDLVEKIAADFEQPFADVHTPMKKAMEEAKAKYGHDYHVAGADGAHADNNGQLVMAYAFLKAMELDNNIATISVDMNDGATASNGHEIISAKDGVIEIRSSRYPFCFFGDGKSPQSTASILPFVPFNETLNHFTLKVTNLPTRAAFITWGNETKIFTKHRLETGINLAAEFLDNPFKPAFERVLREVGNKQRYETDITRVLEGMFNRITKELDGDPETTAYRQSVKSKLLKRQQHYCDTVRSAVVPVTHTIKIKPTQGIR